MNSKEFESLLAQTFQTMQFLTRTKGEEYKGAEDEQLGNFYRGATDAGVSPHVVWLVFFNKHFDAVKSFVRNGKVLSQEHIEGRIDDAILYLVLFKALVRDEDAKRRKEAVLTPDE